MGVAAKELGLKFMKAFIIEGVVCLVWKGIKNKINGKTVFGNKVESKDKTYVDWHNNVILGNEDWEIT